MARLTQQSLDQAFAQGDSATATYEKQKARDAALSQLIKGNQLKQEGIDANLGRAREEAERQGLKPGKYSLNASENSFGVNPEGEGLMDMFRMNALQQQRDEEAVRKLEKRSADAGTAQATPALQRGEEAAPGLFTTPDKDIKLKSMGGLKTLIPNVAVAPLEKYGMLPKGSSAERTAFSELMNTKLYDASGKAINENEMKRIQDAMGLRGIFEPQEIVAAMRQMGYTVLEKQKGVTAGAPNRIVNKFSTEGGLAGKKTMADLIGATAKSKTQNSGKVTVSNGSDTLEIDPQDLAEAQRDGYKVVK